MRDIPGYPFLSPGMVSPIMIPTRLIPVIRIRLILTFVAVLLASTVASAQSVNLAWDPSTDSTVTGYVIKWGTAPQIYTSSVDVGNRTSWTVTGLIPDQKYFFAVTSYASTGASSVPSNEVSNDALIAQTGGQLYDQRPGIFWHNQVTGQLQTWLVAGTSVVDTRPIMPVTMSGVSDTRWKVAGTGDLDGDGFSDILWRRDTDGWLAVWFLRYNAVVRTSYLSINRMPDPNWQIKGLGDVDGDKCADIIWQHTNGSIAAWLMRDTTVTSTRFFSIPSVGASQWEIVGVADVNGDGMADLIWQHASEGWLAVWHLAGTTVTDTLFLSINRVPDTNWQIQTAGDVDGSGTPAIIWRHVTDGWVARWNLRGNTVTGTYFFSASKVDDLNWKIVGSR